ncbi:MAG: hypothetical protein ACI814_003958, partial [Mariniblastus sp.]
MRLAGTSRTLLVFAKTPPKRRMEQPRRLSSIMTPVREHTFCHGTPLFAIKHSRVHMEQGIHMEFHGDEWTPINVVSCFAVDVVVGSPFGYNHWMIETSHSRNPKRRWLRFSLRSFLIAATLVGVIGGSYAYRAERQKRAVQWLNSTDGHFQYDYQFDVKA